jgi:protein-S-isoprenylcysteine O-methyltransferase Ste14
MINNYVVAAGTIFIILFSWFLSIKHKRYHGIARFFAFESVFILLLLNYRFWFHDPFSAAQVISWVLLFLSAYIVIAGYLTLTRLGKPDSNFENTSVLVRSGLYKYIRHPLYLSIFLLGTGIMLKQTDRITAILGTINLIAVYITARIEEREMIARFGEEYRIYMKESKMFIPFVL